MWLFTVITVQSLGQANLLMHDFNGPLGEPNFILESQNIGSTLTNFRILV
jgi:hypothetical protein